MKKLLLVFFVLATSLSLINKVSSQTLGFSGPTSAVSGQPFTLTATGETADRWIASIYVIYLNYTRPANSSSSDYLTYTNWVPVNYYKDANNPTKIKITLANPFSVPVDVTINFGSPALRDKTSNIGTQDINYTITINPVPIAPPTHYYYFGNSVTYEEYHAKWIYDRYGDGGSGVSTVGPMLLKQVHYTPAEGITKFAITDGGDAYDLVSKTGGGVIVLPFPFPHP